MLQLVRRARRRIVENHALREGANAASAALLAFIILLVVGTEVLSWYWTVLLPAGAIAFAAWRVRKRAPSLYQTAQAIDRNAGLPDSISTAVHFGTDREAAAKVSPELVRLQTQDAERAAATVDLRRVLPYRLPRTAYATGALLLIASSVFALRYGLTERLDLKQPLATILGQRLGFGEKSELAKLDPRRDPDQKSDGDPAAEDGQATPPADPLPQEDQAESSSDQNQDKAAKADSKGKNQEKSDADDGGEADQSEQPADGQQQASNQQKDGKESQSGSQNAQNSQSNQSLLSKMKEAMQNLLSSMQQNQQQQQSASNQNGKGSKGQQNGTKQQQAKGEKTNSPSSDAQDQQAADGQQAQNQQSPSSERQDSPLANKQPGSGAGNRDGAKDVRQAQQLAAMGKISEIIGKRAANVTGEATIDVQNTSQQLRTAYQNRQAEHSQAGTEINRDEIPVALESYVEQYFEQVRKQPVEKK